jgi:hypothetical protein
LVGTKPILPLKAYCGKCAAEAMFIDSRKVTSQYLFPARISLVLDGVAKLGTGSQKERKVRPFAHEAKPIDLIRHGEHGCVVLEVQSNCEAQNGQQPVPNPLSLPIVSRRDIHGALPSPQVSKAHLSLAQATSATATPQLLVGPFGGCFL